MLPCTYGSDFVIVEASKSAYIARPRGISCGERGHSQLNDALAVESLGRLREVGSEPIDEVVVSSIIGAVKGDRFVRIKFFLLQVS